METIMNTIKSFTTPVPEDTKPHTDTDTTKPATSSESHDQTSPSHDQAASSHDQAASAPHPSGVLHAGDAHAPEPPTTLPGSFDNDSSTPQPTHSATTDTTDPPTAPQPQPETSTQSTEPRLPQMQTSGLGGALASSHLTHLTHVDADNASTTAVQDEPDSTSPEKKGAFKEEFGAPSSGETGLESGMGAVGLGEGEKSEPKLSSPQGEAGTDDSEGTKVHDATSDAPKDFGVLGGSHLNSSDNRGPSTSFDKDQEPSVTSVPGKVGAFDSEGTKVHDSTDESPKPFGVLGGEHLNSSDNRAPSTASFGDQEPSVTSHPGKIGAFNAEGDKVHDATDSSPKPFGVLGGAHLNSRDNKPSTAGQPLQDDQGKDVLAPGPAMMALPPTEPTSTTDLNASSADSSRHVPSASSDLKTSSTGSGLNVPSADSSLNAPSSASDLNTPSHDSGLNAPTGISDRSPSPPADPTAAEKSLPPPSHLGDDHHAPTQTRRSLTPTPSRGEHEGVERKSEESSSVNDDGSPRKVKMGEKVKGLVTEMKGHVKKDPIMVEEGKAIRHGEPHVGATA